MFIDDRKQDYRSILEKTKNAIGEKNFFNLEIAMYVDMYLEDKKVSNNDFDRICSYIKSIYIRTEKYELFNTVYHIITYLKTNTISSLESIKFDDFIKDFIEARDNNKSNITLFA